MFKKSRQSRRRTGWNYNSSAFYFVTVKTDTPCYRFSIIVNDKAQLTECGKILRKEWLQIPNNWQGLNIKLDEFVVMPDHFHGLVFIGDNSFQHQHRIQAVSDQDYKVSSRLRSPSKNLSSIIRSFKGRCTRQIRELGFEDFQWQRSFHDSIITRFSDLHKVQGYIKANPRNWKH